MLIEGRGDGRRVEEIGATLSHVLASPGFAGTRRGKLLRYLVEHALAGEADSLSEYGIALDVFGKPESFDPRTESTIRAEMSRLRKSLAEYYETGGAADLWRFEFPTRGYAPSLVRTGSVPADRSAATLPWRRMAVAVILLAVCALAFWRFRVSQMQARSVIVLPFANLTGDAGNDYLADGFSDGLTDFLSHVASLRVVARTSASQFRGKAVDVKNVGRQVNADAAIEGQLLKSGDGVRVIVQIIRTGDGAQILARSFDGEWQDLSRIAGDLSAPVLGALHSGERPPQTHRPDPQAWDLFLKARALRGYAAPDAFNRVLTLLNQAIQRDPLYAEAYSELASTYAGGATNAFIDPTGAAAKVKAAAAQALQLDPFSAQAYAAEGYTEAMLGLDWKGGERELRKALRLMPQNATAHQRLGLILMAQGLFQPALAEARTAADLDPLSPAAGVSIGMVYFMQRRYDDALAEWVKLARMHPDLVTLHYALGMAWESKGDYARAMAEYQTFAAQSPAGAEQCIVHLLALSGHREEARSRLATLEKDQPDQNFSFGLIHGALGERDQAFAYLERAWQQRVCWMLKVHPFLDPLRGDPRYRELLRRSGLE